MLIKNSAGYETVLFYDGECGLCDASVQQILKRDHQQVVRYAPLQGNYAKEHLPAELTKDLNTMVLKHQGGIYLRSTAFIKILDVLDQQRILAWLLKLTPRVLRDFGYRCVAKNRHRFKKSKNSCQLLPPEVRKKLFLD